MTPVRCRLLLLLGAALPATRGAAQAPLSLVEALHRADQHGFAGRIAAAAVRSADARAAGALRGLLPTVRAEAGWLRSNDPLAGFGFLLRHREVTAAAFDPAGLNEPPARSDVSTGLVVEAPLVNPDAWAGRRAATLSRTAAQANADWVQSGSHLDVVRTYYAAVLAREQVAALAAANSAAFTHVRDAETAVSAGVATRSDALLASVRQGEIETQLVAAESAAAIARLRLALVLGTPFDTAWQLPAALPSSIPLSTDTVSLADRGDLRSATANRAAAEADRQRTGLALLPRVNGFGRYDWHDAGSIAGGKAMWTVGVMATWSPFSGGAELAERRRAVADADAASAGADAAQAQARLEQQSAEASVAVAERSLVIATRGVQQATEAHRIVARKYAGGLSAVNELLDAQSAELGARLAAARARFDLVVARAELARANGTDLTSLAAALDAAPGRPE